MKPYAHQISLAKQILVEFKKNNRVLLCGSCSIGKTFISLSLVRGWIKEGLRIGISTYSKSDIRDHWMHEIQNKFPELWPKTQVICSRSILKEQWGRGVPAVSCMDASQTKPLTLFIPQTISSSMGKFDILIIDEAHEFLDVRYSTGKLKKIIKGHSHKSTKILGLSATGFDLIKKGAYFEKASKVMFDVKVALSQKVILDCSTYIEQFKVQFFYEDFSPTGDLNRKGISKWSRYGTTLFAKLKAILDEYTVRGKTLIIVPPGINDRTKNGNEEDVCNFINKAFKKIVAVAKSSRYDNDLQAKNEALFRNDSNIKYMVVISMCGTGWDFPELRNVIDLTFTSNPKLIIHRLSRSIRKYPGKKMGQYIYCADGSKPQDIATYYLTRALSLMTDEGIKAYDNKVWAYFISKAGYGKKVSLKDFLEYDSKMKIRMTHKTIFRKSLSDIKMSWGYNDVDQALLPFYQVWKEAKKSLLDLVTLLDPLHAKYQLSVLYLRKTLQFLKRHHRELYDKAYPNLD